MAGFLLGACGGGEGGALATRTGSIATELTGTRPAETAAPTPPALTLLPPTPSPTVTTPTTTAALPSETTTSVITSTTTQTQTETATPPPPITITQTQTTVTAPVAPATTTTVSTTTTAVAVAPTSATNSTPWGWIALVLGLAAAVLLGILIWSRRRAGAASWSSRLAHLTRRCLAALDDVVARGSVVTGRVQALAAEARSLEQRAPDDRSRAAAAQVRSRLDDLAGALESDRALRLGSPPPSEEQISYSTALIRQQVEELERVLRPPRTDRPPARA